MRLFQHGNSVRAAPTIANQPGKWVLACVTASCIAGCRSDVVTCPQSLEPALAVNVVDSIAGAPPGSAPMIISVNGGRTDTVTTPFGNPSSSTYLVGFGRSGQFDLLIKAAGYHDWTMNGVSVSADQCGVPREVSITARLQR